MAISIVTMVYICMYVCMYSFFNGTFMRASTNNLDSLMNWTLHAGWRVDLTTHRGRKGNKLKRRQELEREARQKESKKQSWR